jgi:hypothetical protein
MRQSKISGLELLRLQTHSLVQEFDRLKGSINSGKEHEFDSRGS